MYAFQIISYKRDFIVLQYHMCEYLYRFIKEIRDKVLVLPPILLPNKCIKNNWCSWFAILARVGRRWFGRIIHQRLNANHINRKLDHFDTKHYTSFKIYNSTVIKVWYRMRQNVVYVINHLKYQLLILYINLELIVLLHFWIVCSKHIASVSFWLFGYFNEAL